MSKLQKHNVGYFTCTNNGKVIPLRDALENAIFIFDEIVN